jgi:hypothetical protein
MTSGPGVSGALLAPAKTLLTLWIGSRNRAVLRHKILTCGAKIRSKVKTYPELMPKGGHG